MIRLQNVTKVFSTDGGRKVVCKDVSAVFPKGVSVGLMGRNGSGKSTLLRMIAGTVNPTSGRIIASGSVSWPVGLAGSFHPELTGAQNTRFVARVYGVDTGALCDFVEDFAELGPHFRMPLRTYSSGMRSRLAFGLSMGIHFDTYLVDEITAVGDAVFRKKSKEIFRERLRSSGAIFVSHSTLQIREVCTQGAVLENGQLTIYENLEESIRAYRTLLGLPAEDPRVAKLVNVSDDEE